MCVVWVLLRGREREKDGRGERRGEREKERMVSFNSFFFNFWISWRC